jgi:hypothetical protein
MLVKPLVADALATLQHEKGWFVMIRLNNLPGAEVEIAAGLRALTPHMPALLQQHTKGHQLHKAAWRLVTHFSVPRRPLCSSTMGVVLSMSRCFGCKDLAWQVVRWSLHFGFAAPGQQAGVTASRIQLLCSGLLGCQIKRMSVLLQCDALEAGTPYRGVVSEALAAVAQVQSINFLSMYGPASRCLLASQHHTLGFRVLNPNPWVARCSWTTRACCCRRCRTTTPSGFQSRRCMASRRLPASGWAPQLLTTSCALDVPARNGGPG